MGNCNPRRIYVIGKPVIDADRFDIEQEIVGIGTFAAIIKNYADALYDGQYTEKTIDSVHTTLHGIANLLDSHMDMMMLSHCKHYRLNEYSKEGSEDE